MLLPFGRQLAEPRVVPQDSFLLRRRKILVLTQPFSAVGPGAFGIAALAGLICIAAAPSSLILREHPRTT